MFNGLVLTAKGIEMLINQLNGHSLEFTVIKMGDGSKPSDISNMTDLVSVKQSLPVERASSIDNSTMLIGANLYGTNVKEGFYWKEVGLFAKDPDGDDIEYLFSYDNAGDQASYIPAGGAVTEQLIDLNVAVGNAENIYINIDQSMALVTKEELATAIGNLNTQLRTKIETDVKSVNDALTKHINNKENPHAVTKNQVGLGLVQNYGKATKANAQGGTADDVYMTPLRTKEAMEALGVISDGNVIIKVSSQQPAVQSGKTIIWINTGS